MFPINLSEARQNFFNYPLRHFQAGAEQPDNYMPAFVPPRPQAVVKVLTVGMTRPIKTLWKRRLKGRKK
jgi:hypothetical protein